MPPSLLGESEAVNVIDAVGSSSGHRGNYDGLAAPAQHRIMDPLCDVEPFQRTPAWPTALRIRLAHSPHAPGFRPPYGLEQKFFCSLGIRPRGRGSWVNPTRSVDRTSLRPCPGSRWSPPCGTPVLPCASCASRYSAQATHRKPASRFIEGEPPLRPCSPLPLFMLPVVVALLRDAAAILSIKSAIHPTPHSCHETCLPTAAGFTPAPSSCASRSGHRWHGSVHVPVQTDRRPGTLEARSVETVHESCGSGCVRGRVCPSRSRATGRHIPRPPGLLRLVGAVSASRPRSPALRSQAPAAKGRQNRRGAVAPPPAKVSPPLGTPPLPERTTYGFPLPPTASRSVNPSLSLGR